MMFVFSCVKLNFVPLVLALRIARSFFRDKLLYTTILNRCTKRVWCSYCKQVVLLYCESLFFSFLKQNGEYKIKCGN